MTAKDSTTTNDLDEQLAELVAAAQLDDRVATGLAAFRAASPFVPNVPAVTYAPVQYSTSGNVLAQA